MARVSVYNRPASILIDEESDEIARWIAEDNSRGFAEVLREAIVAGLPHVEGYRGAAAKFLDGQKAPRQERTGGRAPQPGSRRTTARERRGGRATTRTDR